MTVREPGYKAITVLLPKELHREIKIHAAQAGSSLKAEFIAAVRTHLSKGGEK